jgi:hypothetical protein
MEELMGQENHERIVVEKTLGAGHETFWRHVDMRKGSQ